MSASVSNFDKTPIYFVKLGVNQMLLVAASPVNLSEKKAWPRINFNIIFFVLFGMVYVSGTNSEKFA